MADYQMDDNLPVDYEQIERGIAKVRFSEDGDDYVESHYDTHDSEMIADNDNETLLAKLSISSSESDVSSSNSDDGRAVSGFMKSATVSAVGDFAEPSDTSQTHSDMHLSKSKSSPEMFDAAGNKSELEKLLATHMDVTRVLDRLYLSDYMSLSAAKLTELGVSLVINATYEVPNVDVPDGSVEFIQLHINDVVTANMAQHMDVCADRIHEVRSAGGVALVHCALGISRSVTICLAYLVKHEGRTLREAYFELKKKRPIIRPNEGFWRQLIAFETAKRGRATVKLSVYPMGVIPDVYRGAPQTVKMRRFHVSMITYCLHQRYNVVSCYTSYRMKKGGFDHVKL